MSEILFADDDEITRETVAAALTAAGHRVRLAGDGAAALREVERAPPDLVLLDWRMGEPDGLEVCRRLKRDPRYAHLPVIIFTGEGGELDHRLAGFDAGADEYLSKPIDARELLARVGALLQLARRGMERNPTTGLPGGEAIRAEFARRRALGEPFAVCYLDLDHFKPFAERFGFSVADAVIREVGDALAAVTATADAFAGHVGGDDFLVLCPPARARALVEQAQARLRERLKAYLPADAASAGRYRGVDREGVEREFPLTRLSAAIVRVDPARWASVDELGEAVAVLKRQAKHVTDTGIVEADLPA